MMSALTFLNWAAYLQEGEVDGGQVGRQTHHEDSAVEQHQRDAVLGVRRLAGRRGAVVEAGGDGLGHGGHMHDLCGPGEGRETKVKTRTRYTEVTSKSCDNW